MQKDRVSSISLILLVAISIFGMALVPVLALQSRLEQIQSARSVLVGTLYSVVCMLGILAVFYPSKCRGIFQKTQNPLRRRKEPSDLLQLKGHHPDCKNYLGNTLRVGKHVICAACGGLLVGAVLALVGSGLYFFVGLDATWSSVWSIALGEICLFFGLVQIRFAGYVKMFWNLVFVVGSFVLLVGADVLSGSLLVDLYVLGLIVFMLWVRISLSEWNNTRVCQKCGSCFQQLN